MYYESLFLVFAAGFLAGFLVAQALYAPLKSVVMRIREAVAAGRAGATPAEKPKATEVVGMVHDLLDRNAALAQQLSSAFDNVAHDLRTPVTRLRASAEGALEKEGDLTDAREALADCLEESERVLTILNTLMDVAEAQTGNMRLSLVEVSVHELVDEVLDLYEEVADEAGVELINRVREGLFVSGDRTRLLQVIANLVDNAIKYNREGGFVHIDGGTSEGCIVISVSDNGMGIPEEEQERIFERLYRSDRSRSRRGLGLGLSYVKAVVEAHKGAVRVESRQGEGAAFYVRLPAPGAGASHS